MGAKGRNLPVSHFRRLVTDLMYFSGQVPSVTAERRMDLRPLMAARQAASPKIGWCTLFAKAFAQLGRDYPEMRRSYLKCPWPRLYEHPYHVASINVSRVHNHESIVLYCLVHRPETRPLAEIDAKVRHHKEAPLHELRSFVRSVRVSQIPWPFRRPFWWAALNIIGRRRCHNYGTFGITSVAADGAGLLHLIPLLTSSLHFGIFEDGRLDVRLSWDHRVMDGSLVARALTDFEDILNREMTRELTGPLRLVG